MYLKRLALLSVAVVAAHANLIPGGPSDRYITAYSVTLQPSFPTVTNILMLEEGPGFGSGTWAFQADGDNPDFPVTTLLVNPFPHSDIPTTALLMEIATDFPGDAPGQQHVVLMMDPFAAALSNHIAWGTLFRSTLEEDLIAAIQLATSGQDFPIIDPGLDFLSNFAHGDAVDGILGPGGIPQSAWFTPGGAFSVMGFSDGQVIGTGASDVTVAAPEPATIVYFSLALLAFPILKRRRRA
jgi:hypothetical protein